MGACTSGKVSKLRSEAQLLAQAYDSLLEEISNHRAQVIARFASNESEREQSLREFCFSNDFHFVSSHDPGLKQRVSAPYEIQALHAIEQKFQHIEKTFKSNTSLVLLFETNLNRKPVQHVLSQRALIFDYFYSNLELTTIPDEII